MTPKEYISLYEKCNAGNCTVDEKKLLEEYQDNFELTEGEWNAGMGTKEEVRSAIYNKLQKNIGGAPVRKLVPARYWVAAASVILALSVSLLLFRDKKASEVRTNNPTAYIKHDILPGGNKAILTLANGSKIILGNSGRITLTNQGQATINKLNNGQLVYSVNSKQAQSTTLYNTATTPKGGQYEVVLSDGTKVWLNAASSLKYPVVFSGNERHVELTGEAYFEVAKNKKMPFSVAVKGTSIQVLGTHFNVMAYDDDSNMITTLLEGSVKLRKEGAETLLKPGQQAVLADGQANYRVSEVNTDEAVAWKNGYFIFDNENIQSIMKRVARWYDVDVKYNGAVKDQDFGGAVSRFSNVTELLKVLELTGTIHFKIEGRAITVMP
ncbi:FecR family protein [Mucilaginibacter sp. OK098]|uniref:FecR family protein n=1 Tax=Mucilaginibacter sp. OK098 TaxID=1855297 RepID=UPI00091A5591|nr:FecR family protein [Mucilaginibacter sp. OK098]SHN12085.1 FecR family protein [Mucilaginibacter sp. OK098]